jgi:hypothetical protein
LRELAVEFGVNVEGEDGVGGEDLEKEEILQVAQKTEKKIWHILDEDFYLFA